jgi:hypothetical protein
VRKDFYRNSTKPSLKNCSILRSPIVDQGCETDKLDLFLSMMSEHMLVEEFKDHESPLPKCSRYSMSPKDNKGRLQGASP